MSKTKQTTCSLLIHCQQSQPHYDDEGHLTILEQWIFAFVGFCFWDNGLSVNRTHCPVGHFFGLLGFWNNGPLEQFAASAMRAVRVS